MTKKKWPKTLSKKEHVQWCFDCISACEASGIRDPETTIPKMVEAVDQAVSDLQCMANVNDDPIVNEQINRLTASLGMILATINDESEVGDG